MNSTILFTFILSALLIQATCSIQAKMRPTKEAVGVQVCIFYMINYITLHLIKLFYNRYVHMITIKLMIKHLRGKTFAICQQYS